MTAAMTDDEMDRTFPPLAEQDGEALVAQVERDIVRVVVDAPMSPHARLLAVTAASLGMRHIAVADYYERAGMRKMLALIADHGSDIVLRRGHDGTMIGVPAQAAVLYGEDKILALLGVDATGEEGS